MSTFLTRLTAYANLVSRDLLEKDGIAVQQGPAGLIIKTKEGTWTLVFQPKPGVKEALAKLNGVQTTCMYKPGGHHDDGSGRHTP